MKLLTLSSTPLGTIGGSDLGPFGLMGSTAGTGVAGGTNALRSVTAILSNVIGIITVAASIWLVINILVAGLKWIGGSGDAKKIQEAQNSITNALIGFLIIVAGWTILALAGQFFGYDILIMHPDVIIRQFGF